MFDLAQDSTRLGHFLSHLAHLTALHRLVYLSLLEYRWSASGAHDVASHSGVVFI